MALPFSRPLQQYFSLKTASIKAKSLWNDVFPSHIISLRLQGRQYFGLPGNPAPFFRGSLCTKNFLAFEVGPVRYPRRTAAKRKMYYVLEYACCYGVEDYNTQSLNCEASNRRRRGRRSNTCFRRDYCQWSSWCVLVWHKQRDLLRRPRR